MARKIEFVPTATPTKFVASLDSVPQDVRDEVEQIYAGMKANPRGRMRAEFDSKEEREQYMGQVKTYCELRPAGAIRLRRSPTKGLPETVAEFRITDFETEAEKEAREIREAAAKAAKAAKAAEAPATPAVEIPAPKPSPKAKGK